MRDYKIKAILWAILTGVLLMICWSQGLINPQFEMVFKGTIGFGVIWGIGSVMYAKSIERR